MLHFVMLSVDFIMARIIWYSTVEVFLGRITSLTFISFGPHWQMPKTHAKDNQKPGLETGYWKHSYLH